MKRIKIILVLFCFIIIYQNIRAQSRESDGNGTTVVIWANHPLIFLGAGTSNVDKGLKSGSNLGNLINFNLNAYFPVIKKENLSFGLNTGFDYGFNNSSDFKSLPNPYQVTGQSTPPVITAKGSGSPKQQGFRFEAGPSAMVKVGRGDFGINPSLNAAYLNINQKSFTATQTSQVNSTTYHWDLLNQNEIKTNGLGIVPKLRLLYMFGRIGIWMEGSYTIGPKVSTVSTIYHPEGNIHQDGTYDLGQMNFPSYTTSETSSKYRAFSISGGVVIGLGGRNRIRYTGDGSTHLNPNTGVIPAMIHTRVFCIDGKKVMKYYNSQGLVENPAPIYSDIPCDTSTWPIAGIMGDLHVNSDTGPLSPIKNWNGTIKNLFEVPEDYMIVPSIDRFVEKMNKSTPYKTSVIADGSQKYLKVVNWDGKESKTEFTPVIDTSPVGIIMGYHYSCKGSCPYGCGMKNGHCAPCDFAGQICYEVKDGSYNFHKEFPVIKIDPFLVDNTNNTGNTKYNEFIKNLFPIDYKIMNSETVTEEGNRFLALFISNGSRQMILLNKIVNGSTTTDWIGFYNPALPVSIKKGSLSSELIKLAKNRDNYFGHVSY